MRVSVNNSVLLIAAGALSAAAVSAVAFAGDTGGSAWGGGTDAKGGSAACSDDARYKMMIEGICVGNPIAVAISNTGGEHLGEVADSRDGKHPDTDYVKVTFKGALPEDLKKWLDGGHTAVVGGLANARGHEGSEGRKPQKVTIEAASEDKIKGQEIVLNDALPMSDSNVKVEGSKASDAAGKSSEDSVLKLVCKSYSETDKSGKLGGSVVSGGTAGWGK
jgi:hypothetical protein